MHSTDQDKEEEGGTSSPDDTPRKSGAPTDEDHRAAGDGALTGSIPAGLTRKELERIAKEDRNVEPGTG